MKRLTTILLCLIALCAHNCDPPANASGPTFANGFTSNGPTALNQGTSLVGSIYVQAIADPGAPSVSPNTTGSASHTYYIVGHDGAATCGSGNEGHSAVSAGTTVSNSSSPQNNAVTLPSVYLFYDVLRDLNTTSIATCVAAGSVVTDTGQATSVYSPPAGNTTGTIKNTTLLNVTLTNPTLSGTTTAGQINATGLSVSGSLASAAFTSTGTHPATTGLLQDVNAHTAVAARNAANGADIALLGSDASNDILIGDSVNGVDVYIQDPLEILESAAPSGEAGNTLCWADSTAHTVKCNNNNGGATFLVTAASSGSAGVVPKYTGTNAALGSSAITDNGTVVSLAEALQLVEQAAPSGSAGKAICWADSTNHDLECKLNNGAAVSVGMTTGAFTNNHCVQASVSGSVLTLTDAGGACNNASTTSVWMGAANFATRNATNYMQFGQQQSTAAVIAEINAQGVVASQNASVTIKNLFCNWGTISNLFTITVDKVHGGVTSSTGLSCNSGVATSCSDTADTPTVAGGDLLDIKMVNTSIGQAPGLVQCGFQMLGL